MKKTKSRAFNKDTYLLGCDKDGVYYWLEEAKFDCGWYWGVGYVETYTNNKNPSVAKDINSHSHFDYMFFKQNEDCYDVFKEFFTETVLTDKEIWQLLEIMGTLYTLRKYSDTIYSGGYHITINPCQELIKNEEEYKRINQVIIPALLSQLYKLLSE